MWKSVVLLVALVLGAPTQAQESGRIRRPPPSAAEADRIASEMAINDSLLQKGDIVVTDRGFFVFQGPAPDGMSTEFKRVPNPGAAGRPGR